ncbi:hypothetical protein FHR83_003849 [Actinoplanes campanulatus]|uniref:Uncharacterized protein n=1 Tax=Actinoplanes campanulatus TaxID=113559 RepID=A0A7W5AI63_9ACTN|nr:hypothetical protein [Actinoplanes campanulatus]MBB3096179.1 hypothetical protein [Actinoplanes campanulatus]GGN14314.1 hypothetical protein GCM10010109_25640 [Actinoplanes campanulatus]GID36726.1 hypothetical protein Aca09nite_32320 [Actinoplanes campanulatus]
MPQSRFVDSGRWLPSFAGEFLVRCPRCPATATVRRGWDREARWWEPAAVTCGGCGFARRQDRRAGCECGRCRRPLPPGWSGPVRVCVRGHCGTCGSPVRVWRREEAAPGYRTVTVDCATCGATAESGYDLHPVTVPDAVVDNCFGLPLRLQAPCAGHTLWAFNAAHLAYLEDYLRAGLRERHDAPAKSVISHLPRWLKQAGVRAEALRAVRRLERLLPAL